MNPPVVSLFGPVAIRTESKATTQFRSSRVKALLAYLCLHPRGEAPREEIADRLWPELDEAAGRNNLRVTLQYLKQALAEHCLEGALLTADRGRIGLDRESIASDVQSFRELVREIRSGKGDPVSGMEQALALAKAPLTPSLFDDWLEPYRSELAQERFAILCRLATVYLDSNCARALELGRTAAVEHPYLSEPRELIAEALLRLGEPSAAVTELIGFQESLISELGSELAESTRALLTRAEATATAAPANPNVPAAFTRFFGREKELAEIRSWVLQEDQRILTLFGPGGVGKTRLAAEAVRQSDGMRLSWVDAETVNTGDGLLEQIARTVVPGQQASDAVGRIRTWVQAAPALVVLDNLEQISDAELRAVERLLRSIGSLKVLATSRRTLGMAGERLIRVEPLAPDREGVELFLDRARASRPDLELEGGQMSQVREICGSLEGIPLAIELAAARLISLSIGELAEGMQNRLDLLVARRFAETRHGAMRSTIEWSFSQLTSGARSRIIQLGVLHGRWSSQAASAVWGADANTRDTLEVAVENSLLSISSGAKVTRYRMLDCVREYCLECLSDDEFAVLRRRTADYFYRRSQEIGSFDELDNEWPNVEASLQVLAEEQPEQAVDMVAMLLPLIGGTGNGAIVLRLLSTIEVRSPEQARLAWLRGSLQLSGAQFSDALASAARILECDADPWLRLRAHILQARALLMDGRFKEAWLDASQALDLTGGQESIDRRDAVMVAAKTKFNLLQNEDALELVTEALRITREVGDRAGLPECQDMLGCLLIRTAEYDDAERCYREQLDAPDLPLRFRGRAWGRLGEIALQIGDVSGAIARFETGLELARKAQDNWAIAQILVHLGDSLLLIDRFDAALTVFGEALQLRRATGERLGFTACEQGLARAFLGKGELTKAAEHFRLAIDHCREVDDRRLLLRLLVTYARVLCRLSRFAEARALLGEVFELQDSGKAPQTPEELAELAGDLAYLRKLASQDH